MPFDFGSPKTKATRRRASFMAPSAQVDDPLGGVEYTGSVEVDSAAELDALAQGFRQRRDDEQKRFQQATDSEYWFAVCFKDRDSKEAFLRAIKAGRLGDKYIDGHALAKLLGVDLD